MKKNPKLEGTPLHDCIPQTGTCPVNCNQCYFNRPNAYYYPIDQLPLIPTDVSDGIVRMNCGHDSNINKETVLFVAERYKHVFFNTSLPRLWFPGPVVFTANPKEEESAHLVITPPKNLMFVRLRTSGTNLHLIDQAVKHYTGFDIPVVITMMAYYNDHIPVVREPGYFAEDCYVWQKRHINSYWCPTEAFKRAVMRRFHSYRNVTLCGTFTSNWCRDCRNCESYYWQTLKRIV
ncbi:MAG: hypothetical protein V3V68_05240 [Nitrosomonadaceae bacterium]